MKRMLLVTAVWVGLWIVAGVAGGLAQSSIVVPNADEWNTLCRVLAMFCVGAALLGIPVLVIAWSVLFFRWATRPALRRGKPIVHQYLDDVGTTAKKPDPGHRWLS